MLLQDLGSHVAETDSSATTVKNHPASHFVATKQQLLGVTALPPSGLLGHPPASLSGRAPQGSGDTFMGNLDFTCRRCCNTLLP